MHPNIWYPFTNIKDTPELPKVTKGEGIWLELVDGRRVMDCISSWWVNIHGHAHPKVAEAVAEQAEKLEQVIFASFTHDPAEQVAERLAEELPGQLNRVFFSDDGSTAVEVAMKMAYQYWKNRGEERKTFLCFEGAYHGDTFGAMSAGARSMFTEVFKELLFEVEFAPFPETWINDDERERREGEALSRIEKLLKKNPQRFAGIMIEPLVQGAGGMRMCSEHFLVELRRMSREWNTLLIFDEVMTGFGRTGSWFASRKAGVEPDIICLAKGLTAGFIPMSVTVCSDEIHNTFISSDPMKTFWHGHSYTANPIGCAASLASMELMDTHKEVYTAMEQWHREELERLMDHPMIKHHRLCGTIGAMDIVTDEQEGYLNPIADRIKRQSIDKGMLLRPLGNVVYLMPPYCVNRGELGQMYEVLEELLDGA